ncbi:hypothetical protein [Salinisphaera hydrothermalis]|uniref:DUF5666 domain-containing protein n=1 Tax=Salinisphaera hydrothermalis (strain C41B8) TaxID=1304275 RepID=A0A084IQL5_SALHC|nr:hypothetical protein [Salinisphaera hydrothermalis]KEZ78999.1 hypothetical protein C41B8_02677 [Salinisphaera hydrothermalis C41B8]
MKHGITNTTRTRVAVTCALALAGAVVALPAMAADATVHLRGKITAVNKNGFTMITNDDTKRRIVLSSETKIAAVTPGDLSSIEKGTFIGTANVKRDGQNQALEMVIFPASMKGTGLGDYGWDLSPSMAQGGHSASQTANGGGSMTAGSSMTNGTVTAKSDGSMSGGSSMTNGSVTAKSGGSMSSGSSMTNGTVMNQSTSRGSITLQVNYGKGSKTIVVPSDVPTVKVQPGSRADIKTGAHVFVAGPKTNGPVTAGRVIVGKNGTVPPM